MAKERRKKGRLGCFSLVLLLGFIGVFCVAGYNFTTELRGMMKERNAFDGLAKQVHAARQAAVDAAAAPESANAAPAGQQGAPEPTGAVPPGQQGAPESAETTASPERQGEQESSVGGEPAELIEPTPRTILPEYAELAAQNEDFYGWVYIEDTPIDYPVMYTPEDPEYYLHRAFDRSYSFSGVPFMGGSCFEGCVNPILYGHDMRNGTMFAALLKYADEAFWMEHPVVQFDTLYEHGTYEVMAAFRSRVYKASEKGVFRYYDYYDLTDPELFDEYVEQVQKAALYDTGITAEYGDELRTMSTCAYHTDDGRFVIVARRVS